MVCLIKFGVTPDQVDALPVNVDAWLMPVLTTIAHIEGAS